MSNSLYGFDGPLAAPYVSPLRRVAAATLRQASLALARLAQQVADRRPPMRAPREADLEFHAEAGAPEGALYLDGELVGYLPGVNRL